jgi:hypothetical protein
VGGDFGGTVVTINGTNYGVSALPVTITQNVGLNISFIYDSPLMVNAGKRYVWTNTTGGLTTDQSGNVTVTGGGNVTGNYKTQYYLTLNSTPPGIGTQTGAGWQDAGTSANISTDEFVDIVPGESRYHFDGWTTANMTEIDDPAALNTTVLIDEAKNVTANYVIQYYLTLDSDPAGLGTQTGEGWYDAHTSANISTDESVDIVPGESRYHFDGWTTGNMSEIDDPAALNTTVLMDQAKNVTANYVIQYYLTLDSDPAGLGTQTGAGWHDAGTSANISTTSPVVSGPDIYFFAGWTTANMSEIDDPAALNTTVLMDQAKNVTANYVELPISAITKGGTPIDHFRLIFTPNLPSDPGHYKLNASNPGQFFYNVIDVGEPYTDMGTLNITIPYPFVTQGAMPVHIYDSVSIVDGQYVPGTDITSEFTISGIPITLEDYDSGSGDFGDTRNITVEGNFTASGLVYVRVHLDYGLKNTAPYTKSVDNAVGDVTIHSPQSYEFAVADGVSDTQSISSENVFKHDPGFAGLVTNGEGDPVSGVKVQIYNSANKLLATVYTDQDGFYFYNYKHTGKAATFTLKLPDYSLVKSVTLKANGLVAVDFQIP